STAPPAAAERPCRPCPASRTRPGPAPCRNPRSSGAASPATAPQDQGHPPPRHSRRDHQHQASCSSGDSPSPPSQLNESSTTTASLEDDTEGEPRLVVCR